MAVRKKSRMNKEFVVYYVNSILTSSIKQNFIN